MYITCGQGKFSSNNLLFCLESMKKIIEQETKTEKKLQKNQAQFYIFKCYAELSSLL